MSQSQFVFRNNLGTRDALFCIQVFVQRCSDYKHPLFICFIDFEKAFVKVRHVELIRLLKNIKIVGKVLRIIRNLYWNQSANIRVNKCVSEDVYGEE